MNDPDVIAESLSALVGYSWPRLILLASWLWERGSRPITPDTLARDCSVIADDHAPLAYRLLIRAGALREGQPGQGAQVEASGLITLLVEVGQRLHPVPTLEANTVELAWTLPAGLHLPLAIQPQRSILDLIRSVISSAQERLWLVSPFINESGLEQIFEPALSALRRGVSLTLITHNLQDVTSPNSHAVHRLRRAVPSSAGQFRAFSARPSNPDENPPHLLLHAKLVTADGRRGYIGSANLTGRGLRENLEIGLGFAGPHVEQVELLLQQVVNSDGVEPF